MPKISIFASILDKSIHFYSIFIKIQQFLHEKLVKNDVFKKNLVKFVNHVETKPLEPVLWNFAWKSRRLCAFRWYKANFCNVDNLGTIKVSLVAVVFDDRVHSLCMFAHCAHGPHVQSLAWSHRSLCWLAQQHSTEFMN